MWAGDPGRIRLGFAEDPFSSTAPRSGWFDPLIDVTAPFSPF